MLACAALPPPSSAQRGAPTVLQPRIWSTEGRAPLWRARIAASDGLVLHGVSLLRRLADGAILSVVEGKPGDDTPGAPRALFIERRDAAGARLWRQPLAGLPPRATWAKVVATTGPMDAPLVLVTTFAPADPTRESAYGSFVAVDARSGTMRVTGSLRFPKARPYLPEDGLGVEHAVVQPSGLIALQGSFGQGPFEWWLGLRRPDGSLLWDVFSRKAEGSIVDVRRLKDGFELSVLNILSDEGKSSGPFLVRIDGTGRVTASARFRGGPTAPVFTRDGGLAWLADDVHRTLIVEDRLGRRHLAVVVPDAGSLLPCLDDGSYVVARTGNTVLVAVDGRSAVAVTADVRPDSSLLVSRCEDERDCRAWVLSLFARPR